MMPKLTAEMMKQSPWYDAYKKVAPEDRFDQLVERVKSIDDSKTYPEKTIRAMKSPVQLVVADSDILYLDHAVKFFQLLGGDVPGDMVPRPKSQLAIIPGATHVTMMLEKGAAGDGHDRHLPRREVISPARPAPRTPRCGSPFSPGLQNPRPLRRSLT